MQEKAPEEEEEEEEDMYTIGLYLAPKDSDQFTLTAHITNKGIDYTGISGETAARPGDHKVAGFSGEAFGVGALEEEDQFSVYDSDKKSDYSTTIEDEEGADDNVHLTHKFVSTKKDYLANFVVGKTDKYLRRNYPAPPVPAGFKPWHIPSTTTIKAQPAATIQERAAKLGITDFDRPSSTPPKPLIKSEEPEKSEKSADIDTKPAQPYALFRPFKSDPSKEERYNMFLKGEKVDYSSTTLTEWERQCEQEEFQKSSKFFKPLSFEMANRFASAGTNVEEDKRKELENQAEKERKEAVRMKMFGQLTRETHQWVPASLLCKRFDVMNPYPE